MFKYGDRVRPVDPNSVFKHAHTITVLAVDRSMQPTIKDGKFIEGDRQIILIEVCKQSVKGKDCFKCWQWAEDFKRENTDVNSPDKNNH